jgi:release factor glutamine methyltransferase
MTASPVRDPLQPIMDVRSALRHGIAQLRAAHVPSDTLAAELLLLHALQRDRTWIYAHPETMLTDAEAHTYQSLLDRRSAGVPTQYLTGKQEFWGLDFEVSPDVLIPRPETEHVVEVALDRLALRELRAGRSNKSDGSGLCIGDIGTGSGCIVIALARELPAAQFVATDISSAALAIARRNAARHSASGSIQFCEANLLPDVAISGSWDAESGSRLFDLIVSNPPYIGRREAHTLPREIREHEPEIALYGGEEGYELYAGLIAQSARYLKPGGFVVLELGHDSLAAVQPLFDSPEWINVDVTRDLAGIPRVIAAERACAQLIPLLELP